MSQIKLWTCPDCGFSFDAAHEDVGGGYTCSHCSKLKIEQEVERLTEVLRQIDTHIMATPDPVPYIAETLKRTLPEYKQEVNELQAGRGLDAKVAEVLGCCVLDDWRHFGQDCFVTDKAMTDFQAKYHHEIPPDLLPHFSTTWEGMGVLVEEAKKQGIYLEFYHDPIDPIGGFYGYSVEFVDGECQMLHETDDPVATAPHAVCLVFLGAKGIEI